MIIKIFWTQINSDKIPAPEELSDYRRQRLSQNNRAQCYASEALLFHALRQLDIGCQLPPLIVCGEHGKPYIKDSPIYFSISHSADVLACAVAECELGLDVQRPTLAGEKLLHRYFDEAERGMISASEDKEICFARLWSAKESYVKATGQGIALGFKDAKIHVGADDELYCGGLHIYTGLIGGFPMGCCPITEKQCEIEITRCF